MKQRNFEASPLTEDEFSMMLLGVDDDLLRIYQRWLDEEFNRRGIAPHVNMKNENVRHLPPPEYTGEW